MSSSRTLFPLSPPEPSSSGARRWLALVVICLAQLLVILDASVINVALPSAQLDLHLSDATRHWGVTSYLLALGALLLIGGRVADVIGRRRAFMIGLAGFAVCSVIGGLATSGALFFAMRAGQGASAALLAPAALSLLTLTFTEPAERGQAFGVYGAVSGVGVAFGMITGGVLTQYTSWRWCMFIAVPLALAAMAGARWLLPESRAEGRVRYDVPSVLMVTGGLACLMYTFTAGETEGWSAPLTCGTFATAVALLVLFFRRQRHVRDPLLPLHLVAHRTRAAGLLAVGFGGLGITGVFLLLTFYFQQALGYSALACGMAYLPYTVGTIAGSSLSGRLLPRTGPRPLLTTGLLVAAAGLALLVRASTHGGYWGGIAPALLIASLGVGAMFAAGSATALSGLAERDAGVAGAVFNCSIEISGALGTALLATVFAAAGGQRTAIGHTGLDGYHTAFATAAALLATGAFLANCLLRRAP
ncbi:MULTISPECIES: MFS transporter [unclassified Streptomyces]|uniref:MFS transporter n=1 Tax=unclassified Streptomyces TaxID=2593676 RepID=UPI002DDADB82|nr:MULTISPECIES: MFS transporter [unclassified Streptomyces]WSC33667.1 MFS transporter [Streptomyces sp. NBC_01768]WSP52540.1 MFS transporter [Streptomyces sp. NBC_01243]